MRPTTGSTTSSPRWSYRYGSSPKGALEGRVLVRGTPMLTSRQGSLRPGEVVTETEFLWGRRTSFERT